MKVEITGRRELMRNLRRAGERGMDALAEGLVVEAEAVMRVSKREAPADLGQIRASGFVERPRRTPRSVAVTFGYGAEHAVYLHEGTGPAVGRPAFMPPVAPFREWARRVLGDESLGFVIARAVGRRGLRPRKFLERPLRRRTRGMAVRLGRRVRASVERR